MAPRGAGGSSSSTSAGGAPRGGGLEPEKKDFWDSFGDAPKGPSRDKQDFWDDFAAVGDQVAQKKPTSIGTSAMKKPGAGGGGPSKKDEDSWGDW